MVRELLLFGLLPIAVILICTLGATGGITEDQAWVPIYTIGLIASVTALVMYGFALLFRGLSRVFARHR